jgi:Protein of unknown function (DUF3040)
MVTRLTIGVRALKPSSRARTPAPRTEATLRSARNDRRTDEGLLKALLRAAGQEHAMSLSYHQENQLRRVEAELRRSDPHLGAMLSMFGKLYPGLDMPASEQVPPVTTCRDRLRRAAAWIVAALIATTMAIRVLLSTVAVPIAGWPIPGAGGIPRTYRPGRGTGTRRGADWDQESGMC